MLAHATSVEALRTGTSYACRAEIGGRRWLLLADGPGPERAKHAVEMAFEQGPVASVVSTGFCGGLDPELKVGEVFVADRVIGDAGQEWPARDVQASEGTAETGALLSRDRVAVSAAEKAQLFESTGARVTEMEAAAVADEAQRRDVPFYCVRVVSDAASDTMPLDFNLYRAPSGRFRRGRIIGAALARPTSIRGLMRLNTDTLRAARRLGDFLVYCRF